MWRERETDRSGEEGRRNKEGPEKEKEKDGCIVVVVDCVVGGEFGVCGLPSLNS